MYRGLLRRAAIALALCLLICSIVPWAAAQVQIRKEARAGDLLYNSEIIILPLERTIFHADTLAASDTEAIAISPLTATGRGGFSLAETSEETSLATSAGFFNALLPYLRIEEYPGETIGDGLNWVASTEPITVAGLPENSMMIFPQMDMVTKTQGPSDADGNSGLQVDAGNRALYYPGNMMQVKNITNEKGEAETALERVPRDYMNIFASPEEVAQKTIVERMWRNVHLNFNLDRAYVGETCYPTWIYPIKDTYALMPFIPDWVSISDSLNMTKPGKHMKRIFWPVAA